MRQSPLAFFRGSACTMAADLAKTKVTDVKVPACGAMKISVDAQKMSFAELLDHARLYLTVE